MSAPKRRATAAELLDDASSSSDVEDVDISFDENGESDEQMDELKVDFEGRAATDSDNHGISLLLKRAFTNVDINVMELADLIIAQNYVGSVLIQNCGDEDDEDEDDSDNATIFGVLTVINISEKKDAKCVQDLRNYILSNAKKHATPEVATKLETILNDEELNVGYIVNERFVNIPCAVSVPGFENLLTELNDLAAEGMPYKFDYMIMSIKYFITDEAGDSPSENILINEEETLFEQVASDVFNFKINVPAEATGGKSKKVNKSGDRMIILFDAERFDETVEKLDKFVNGPKDK